jgi:hypothetical protein
MGLTYNKLFNAIEEYLNHSYDSDSSLDGLSKCKRCNSLAVWDTYTIIVIGQKLKIIRCISCSEIINWIKF